MLKYVYMQKRIKIKKETKEERIFVCIRLYGQFARQCQCDLC